MADGITFDKSNYIKGDTITVTVTDSTRRAFVPGTPDQVETDTANYTLASGQLVTQSFTLTTPGTPDVPGDAPGTVFDTDGRTYKLVTDNGTVAKYTATA